MIWKILWFSNPIPTPLVSRQSHPFSYVIRVILLWKVHQQISRSMLYDEAVKTFIGWQQSDIWVLLSHCLVSVYVKFRCPKCLVPWIIFPGIICFINMPGLARTIDRWPGIDEVRKSGSWSDVRMGRISIEVFFYCLEFFSRLILLSSWI